MSEKPVKYSLAEKVFSNLLGQDHKAVEPLASGENRFDLISDDVQDERRSLASELFFQLEDAGYWNPASKNNRIEIE